MTGRKVLGIAALLLVVCVATALASGAFLSGYNLENLARRSALFGIISIGAMFVIITGGIDLSIGSVICLVGVLTPYLLVEQGWGVPATLVAVLGLSAFIGYAHGWLITRLDLQPFVVTLCGLLIYRGVSRGLTGDQTQGFRGDFGELRALGNGRMELPGVDDFALPMPLIVLAVVALGAAFFLGHTVWGRWLLAIGRNEQAVRYSGVDTGRWTRLAYVLCGLLSGLGGLLFVLDVGSAQPVDFGSFYELYAIAAAVLGGCSLRGGEGTVIGVILGAAVMQVLRNAITLVEAIPDNVEYAVIGGVLLAGAAADELVRRAMAARKRRAAG